MNLDFSVVWPYWFVLAKGLGLTLVFTVTCALVGSLLGFVLSLLRMSPSRWLRGPVTAFVEFFRGTPLLISCSGCSSASRSCCGCRFRRTCRC